jgi:hypothetical protein
MITITYNSHSQQIESAEMLESLLSHLLSQRYQEMWIKGHNESTLLALTNEKSAFLMYLRYSGDVGFVVENEAVAVADEIFFLENGQMDCYSAQNVVDKVWVMKVFSTYFETGEKLSELNWVEG